MYAIESNGVRYEAKTAQEVVELFNLCRDTDAFRLNEQARMDAQIEELRMLRDVAEKQRAA